MRPLTNIFIGLGLSAFLTSVFVTIPDVNQTQADIKALISLDSAMIEVISMQDKEIDFLQKQIKTLEENAKNN